MLVEAVRKLNPLAMFLYWITERSSIRIDKEAKRPKPWTDDAILQTTYFTNVQREHDKVTSWIRTYLRDPLRSDERVLMAVLIARWFNYIPTLAKLLNRWREIPRRQIPGERFGYFTDWKLQRVRNYLENDI